MTKNILVVDLQGKECGVTYPKRAKGLVKKGRARFVNECTICLTRPPHQTEDEKMDDQDRSQDRSRDDRSVEASQVDTLTAEQAERNQAAQDSTLDEVRARLIPNQIGTRAQQTSKLDETMERLKANQVGSRAQQALERVDQLKASQILEQVNMILQKTNYLELGIKEVLSNEDLSDEAVDAAVRMIEARERTNQTMIALLEKMLGLVSDKRN